MPWRTSYRSKLCTPAEAVSFLRPDARVYLGGNAATPRVLADALLQRAEAIAGVTVSHVLLLGDDPFPNTRTQGQQAHVLAPGVGLVLCRRNEHLQHGHHLLQRVAMDVGIEAQRLHKRGSSNNTKDPSTQGPKCVREYAWQALATRVDCTPRTGSSTL